MPPQLAFMIWPVVVMILFRTLRFRVAMIWSIIGGYLLLPPKIYFNFPVLPSIDKFFVASAATLLASLFTLRGMTSRTPARRALKTADPEAASFRPGWIPQDNIIRALLILTVLGAMMTALTNGDPLSYGPRRLPGLRPYDGFSSILTALAWLLPFFMARKFLATPESHRLLLLSLGIAGLLYSLPALYEVRMSPQLNRIVYGYFPGSWVQYIRDGGFRPLVFLVHGLRLGIFFTVAILSSIAYFRSGRNDKRWLLVLAALWIFATLAVSKTLGAFLIATLLIPVALFAGVRLQLLAAAILAAIVLTFPVVRGTGFFPVKPLTSFAQGISPARAQSLAFRFRNEDILLEKARQRPAFGWGGWGRARVYNQNGRDISITDGRWVIVIGRFGWAGYLGEFGLLTIPIILMALRRRKYAITLASSGLGLALAANLADLIPNSGLTPVTLLMAGALVGRLELKRVDESARETPPEPMKMERPSRYARPRPVASAATAPATAPVSAPVSPVPDTSPAATRKRRTYTRFPARTNS